MTSIFVTSNGSTMSAIVEGWRSELERGLVDGATVENVECGSDNKGTEHFSKISSYMAPNS